MRRVQRWIAVLMAVMLMLSSGLSGLAEEISEAASAEKYELLAEEILQQASAEPTAAPIEATEEPTATPEPTATEDPEASEAPEEIVSNEATEAPVSTEVPEESVSNEETEVLATPEVTEAPVSTEVPEESVSTEAPATPEVTEAPVATVAPEKTISNEATPEPAANETESEAPLEEISSVEPTEMPEENLHFSAGYVYMEAESKIYDRVKGETMGKLAADGIVYAALSQEGENPKDDWLKITFDTQALRESDADFAEGYVPYSKVEALSEEETEKLVEEYAEDEEIRWNKNGEFYVPCAAFEEKMATPEATDELLTNVAATTTLGESETDAAEIIGVWYDKGIEARPLQIHVTTSLDAQVLYLYQGDNLLSSWQASEAEIDEYASCKEWHVNYTFDYSGKYYLWYRTSADGTAMSAAYTPDPVQIERPAVIDVWYEKGIEGEPLKIHVTTNLEMKYLYLYLGEDELGSWSAENAEIVEYATCKEWVIEHTFANSGAYYLWYKASKDGEELSLPYSPVAAQIERPAVIEVWYEKGVEGKPLVIHATTNLEMEQLYLYLGEDELGRWSAENAEIVEYATCKEWVIEHTFADPGAYYLWYKASKDGEELSQAYAPAAAQIERPAIIEVWYEEAATDEPAVIHVTTNLDMQTLYMYLGENLLQEWQTAEADIVDYATCKEWTVEYNFEDAGAYYLWYKASKDGTTEELPFAPDPLYVAQSGEMPDATATPEPTVEPTPEPTGFFAAVSSNVEEVLVGESVTWTGSAVNGAEPYKYLFKLYKDEKLLATRAYSADPAYTYTFTEAGSYYVELSVKDDGREVVSAKSGIVTVGVETLRVSEVACDFETIQTAQTTTWTVAVEGGQAPYAYAFVLTKDGATVAEQAYSDQTAFAYEFTEAGDYALAVTVKDALGTVSANYELAVTVAQRPFEIVSLEADVSESETEEAITWTVAAKSGAVPYTYAFELVVDGVSQGKGEAQAEPTFTYTPELAGTYSVIAYVTDADGTTLQNQSDDLIVSTKALAISAVEANGMWLNVGETITWTTTAVGGVKPLRYAFDVYLDGEELDGSAYSNENTLSYTPETAGVYTVTALVRDAQNTTVSVTGGEIVVFTDEGSPAENFTFNALDDTYCEITGYTGTDAVIKLPAKDRDGRVVQRIASRAFVDNKTIRCVVIPDGVKTVGEYAFHHCENLTSIILPDSVETIEGYAFYVSRSLESINYPRSWTNAGTCIFYGCKSLKSITVPEGVTAIPDSAFYYANYLTTVELPSTLKTIGDRAFYRCTALENVILPDSVETIGSSAFSGCTSLESINYPLSWKSAEGAIFSGCKSLKSITVPEGVTAIPDYAFHCANYLRTVELPSTLKTISYSAFEGCASLESIILPDGVETIGSYAFEGCTSLESIILPEGVKTIKYYTFYGCTSLTAIYIGSNVTSISDVAFRNCSFNLVIYGEPGSYAETYASANGIAFSTEAFPETSGLVA